MLVYIVFIINQDKILKLLTLSRKIAQNEKKMRIIETAYKQISDITYSVEEKEKFIRNKD